MKLKELLKLYYKTTKDITMSTPNIPNKIFKELILPGAFKSLEEYRKTLSWNLDREIFYREATKESNTGEDLYVTMTTGKMEFYFIFNNDSEFTELIEKGLKKHRSYRKEYLPWSGTRKYLFYSKKYE